MFLGINGSQYINTDKIRDIAVFSKEFRITFDNQTQFHYYFRTQEEARKACSRFASVVSNNENYTYGECVGDFNFTMQNYSTTPFEK